MNWAISNLTGGNRVSRAILVRYSSVPLADDGSSTGPQTPAATTPRQSTSHTSLSSTFAATFARHVPRQQSNNNNGNNTNNYNGNNSAAGGGGASVASGAGSNPSTQLSLPLDVEETVTCFCR
ncbi:hypothetical protein ACLKA6_011172 [Drosophila palustris]